MISSSDGATLMSVAKIPLYFCPGYVVVCAVFVVLSNIARFCRCTFVVPFPYTAGMVNQDMHLLGMAHSLFESLARLSRVVEVEEESPVVGDQFRSLVKLAHQQSQEMLEILVTTPAPWRPVRLSMAHAAAQAFKEVAPTAPKNIRLRVGLLDFELFIKTQQSLMRRVIGDLVSVAMDSLGAKQGWIHLEVRRWQRPEGSYGALIITDNGRGWGAEPSTIQGLRALARHSGGRCFFDSEIGLGTRVDFMLPLMEHN
jgi:signal transduction histidine kinase